MSRKSITIYIGLVVCGGSIVAAMLGGYLRYSEGDLYWVTVTQPGVGGAVQVGSLEVQSAGSRNTRVAIKGDHADLQFIGVPPRHYYYLHRQQPGFSPFTWQRNLAVSDDDSYQIDIPMTLWGRRRCHATAFSRELQRLDFELDFKPDHRSNRDEFPPGRRSGRILLKLTNRLPFKITYTWLIVGVTEKHSAGSMSPRVRERLRSQFPPQNTSPVDGLVDVYHVQSLQDLEVGQTFQAQYPSRFGAAQLNSDVASNWPTGSQIPPRISHMGAASAWIIGRIDDSPIITIDQDNSDFAPLNQMHLFVQEILPEDLSDSFQLREDESSRSDDRTRSENN